MSYKGIGEYGIIGNGLTLAHVGVDGSIDWMCLPFLDSPSVFAAILDDRKGGRFSLQPSAQWDSVQNYLPRTNMLRTAFRTSSGEAEVIDFMAAGPVAEKDDLTRTLLVRRLQGIQGTVPFRVELTPRFQYATQNPDWVKKKRHLVGGANRHGTTAFFYFKTIRLAGRTDHARYRSRGNRVAVDRLRGP